jgi:hypothetical protein
MAAALLLSGTIRSLLNGVGALGSVTYALVAVGLLGVAVLASLAPAWRAAATDLSLAALRAE